MSALLQSPAEGPFFPGASEVRIATLGKASVLSPLRGECDDHPARLVIDSELCEEFAEPRELLFETAGPRGRLYFDPAKSKAAIVTCGGLCPGLNDVIRSLVRVLRREYGVPSVIGIRHGLWGFMPEAKLGVVDLTLENVFSIHESGGTILGTSRGPQPPDAIVDALHRLNVNMLFVVGGDGTMKAALALDEALRREGRRVAVVGIPKTIDNDINFVPRSFGFETAVGKTVEALRCARIEAMSVQGGIGIVKIMGRESGFIAARAALAFRDADFVLTPESPFDLHGEGALLDSLAAKLAANGHALMAVAEGAGKALALKAEGEDASGNSNLADICAHLMDAIGTHFSARGVRHRFKYIDPSYIVRSVPAGVNDRVYAASLAEHAAHAAISGRTGMVVAQIMDKFVHLPLELVTARRRKIQTRSALWRSVLACTGQGDLRARSAPYPAA